MAQLSIFLDETDKLAFVQLLFDRGFKLIHGRRSERPLFQRHRSLSSFVEADPVWTTAFALRPDYECCPLEVHRLSELPTADKYYIMPRNGGPTIDISWGWEGILDGGLVLRESVISRYPSHWDTRLLENVAASEPLKRAYAEVTAYLRRGAKRARLSDGRKTGVVLARPHAAAEWRAGRLRLGPYKGVEWALR